MIQFEIIESVCGSGGAGGAGGGARYRGNRRD